MRNFVFLLFLLTGNTYAELNARIRITGIVYKKFTPTRVQIKDEYGQILEVARDAFPREFKVEAGKFFSYEFESKKVFYKPKTNHKREISSKYKK